jgi:hypothetical protein
LFQELADHTAWDPTAKTPPPGPVGPS